VDCADEDTIAALMSGALDAGDRRAIAVHAATCAACHALLDGLLDDTPAVEPDAVVGRYVIGDRLGAGGMGVVYAAVDSQLHRKVAIKLLRTEGSGQLGTQGRERLLREARTLASLSHPNVVTVFDVGAHAGNVFLAMELVEGGNLKEWARREPRTTDELIDRLIEAGRGLSAAHATGVVHRDVKPDNILVGRDGHSRVTDFGLARAGHAPEQLDPAASAKAIAAAAALSPDLTRTGTRMGTPVYMAPEQMIAGDAEPRSDQWSFCATVYEVVAGVRPFALDDLDARTAAIAAGRLAEPAPGRRVPRWLARVVARGLRADPGERWPSMDAVVDELVRGRRRRGRAIRWGAGALVVVAASATGVLAMTRPGPAPEPTTYRMPDPRPGCACPMSACADHCASVCRASAYRLGEPVRGVSLPDRQEALLGVSGDGGAILYLSGAAKGCMLDRLMLARRRAGGDDDYEATDLTDRLDRAHVLVEEGCCTLAADGASLLVSRVDRHGFVRVPLRDTGPLAGQDLGDLVPGAPATVIVRFPALSADEHTLYYRVLDSSLGPTDAGPRDGVFASERGAPGVRLPGRARYYDAVTGVSADHLSLFMTSEYRTHVLVRASLDQPFGDPEEGMLPADLPLFRTMPLADCTRLLATHTPGGCAAEDIVWLEATAPASP
jgi:predicted Ser/Thr protein kinase